MQIRQDKVVFLRTLRNAATRLRTCRVCSLLRFDGKKWCFSRLSDQFKPIAVPRPVVLSTGSNALRPYRLGRRMQRATLGVIYTSG